MKTVLAALLISIMAWPLFLNTGLFTYYNIDIKSFTEKYCSNKDKPELRCNGKCKLNSIKISSSATSEKPLNRTHQYIKLPLFLSPMFCLQWRNENRANALLEKFNTKTVSPPLWPLEVPVPPPRLV